MNLNRTESIRFRWLLILLPILFVFYQVTDFEMLNLDDNMHISRNPHLNPPTLSGLKELWKQPYRRLYVPLTYTVWSIATRVNSQPYHPRLFHLLNVLVHTLTCVFLVYPLIYLAVPLPSAALFATICFAIHPLQVEPVVWISGLKDVLSGFFCLLSLRLFTLLLQESEPFARRAYWYRLAVVLSLLAALFSKPSSVVAPTLFAIFGFFVMRRKIREFWFELLVPCLIVCPFIWMTSRSQPLIEMEFTLPNARERFWMVLNTFWFYVVKTLVPLGLTVDYGLTPSRIAGFSSFHRLTLLVLTGILISCLIGALKKSSAKVGPFLMFLCALSPVLGMRPFVFQMISSVADRYAYIALFGAALALGMVVAPLIKYRRARLIMGGSLFILCLLSHAQATHWRNSHELCTYAISRNSESWLAYNNLGVDYESKGEGRLALEQYVRSVQIRPSVTGLNNIGAMYMADHRYRLALESFRQGLAIKPGDPLLLNNLGSAWSALGEYSKARESFLFALQRDPDLKEAKDNLSRLPAHVRADASQTPSG